MARRRTPTSVRLVDGTFRQDRHNAFEPKTAAPASAEPPQHLAPDAQAAWREILATAPAGVLRDADQHMIEVAAVALAQYREVLAAALAKPLLDDTSPNGLRVHPLRTELRRQAASLHRLLSELGFSPVSRSRIVAVEDPAGALLKGWKHGLTG